MWRHLEEDYVVLFAERSKLWCGMAPMVVKNEEPLAANCLCLCLLVEVLDPL